MLCDHDAATVALGDALAVAERRRQRGRAAGFTAKDGGAAPAREMTVPSPMAPPMAPELSVPPGRARAPGHAKRSPSTDLGLRRPWLYALARWACLRALAESRAGGSTRRAAG